MGIDDIKETGTATVENVIEVCQKIKCTMSFASHFWIFTQKIEIRILERYCIPMFTAALFTITKILKPLKCLFMEICIKKTDIYKH